jgi:hypothetical protein
MKNLCGIEVMTPAPSPSLASEPTAPRWVILHRRFRAVVPLAYQPWEWVREYGKQLTIADDLVAGIALDVAGSKLVSAGSIEQNAVDSVLTRQSPHHRHPSRAQGHTDPA